MSDRLKRLIREVHRRSLWQVLGIYVVASGAVLGGVDTLASRSRLRYVTRHVQFLVVRLFVARLCSARGGSHA